MNLLIFLLSTLAVVRICILLQEDIGPFHIFEKFRKWAGLQRVDELDMPQQIMYSDREYIHNGEFFAELLECIYCLSIWIGAIVAIYLGVVGLIAIKLIPIYALAFSALAILIKNRRIISD